MRKRVVGIMGPGETATPIDCDRAFALGRAIAEAGWVLLSGGRSTGVMEAANRGAKSAGGLTIGILPDADRQSASEFVDIAIATDLGQGRNNVNVLSCDAVIACGMGLGTASEVALALKVGKPVILLSDDDLAGQFFSRLAPDRVAIARTVEEALAFIPFASESVGNLPER